MKRSFDSNGKSFMVGAGGGAPSSGVRSFFERGGGTAVVPYSDAQPPVLQPTPANMDTSLQNSAAANSYYPPWIQPPPQFDPVDKISYVTIPAIGLSEIVLEYRVSRGRNGVIKSYANNYIGDGFQEGSGNLYWQYLRNGNPIKFYERVLASLGRVESPTEHPSGFRVFDNDLIQILVFNVSIDPAGQLIGGRILGWQYPKKYEDPRAWV
jgi:hypothetical protein